MEKKPLKTVEEAEKDLKDFLEKHPHLKEYQKEIDRRLKLAVTPELRQTVLQFMMVDRLISLGNELAKVSSVVAKGFEGKK